MTAPGNLLKRLTATVRGALSGPGRRTSARRGSETAVRALEDVGLLGVGWSSPDEKIAEWEKRLWAEQDDLLEERLKEWRQHLHYVANEQFIAYHRDRRVWIPRRTVPWRIRSIYNVMGKAVKIRTARLSENKPAVTVQATRPDRASIEKAEFKETLFWFLWDALSIHSKWKRARRWACKGAPASSSSGGTPTPEASTPRRSSSRGMSRCRSSIRRPASRSSTRSPDSHSCSSSSPASMSSTSMSSRTR
jgi:hypothetical protein